MKTPTQRDYEERILRVLVHVQAHLDDALDLEHLARIACFSPYHFHRVFRGMVGEPVKEHVRRLRLERAALRLTQTDQSVIRIALDAGYEAHEAFTRAFRAQFGVPPSRFREQRREALQPATVGGVHYAPDGRLDRFRIFVSGGDSMEVRVEDLRPLRVAFVRHVGPYAEVGKAWERLCAWAGPRGLFGPQARMLGVSHDDPDVTPPDKLRYDACISVADTVRPEGDIGIQNVGGGPYAVTTHHGPYERLAETYAVLLGQWLPAHNREPLSLPSLEFYLNSPEHTPPEQLRTDVCVPLKPQSA